MHELSPFEGKPVVAVGVEMPNAAGGLQEAMKFDPVEWHQGEEGYIVLHYTTQKVRFEPINRDYPAGDQRRVHVLTVDQAAPIEAEHVQEQLAAHSERIKKAKDEAKGTPALDFDGGQLRGELEQKKTPELKAILKDRGLSQSGGKQDLIQRLIDARG